MKSEKENNILSSINSPYDLRQLPVKELPCLATELRERTIEVVSKTGGHLGASLGVVELTVALHYVFETPVDLLVWDIGHQGYPHKILTERNKDIHTLRQPNGLSGFLKMTESVYDTFGAGHSSTSLSAALGMAVARDINKKNHHVVAIIGDSSLSAGMAYEAMNNAGYLKSRVIYILNDNEMSIAPATGALNKYLLRLTSSKNFLRAKKIGSKITQMMPKPLEELARTAKKYTKDLVDHGNFFEEFGFHYIGPVDGHDVELLVEVLQNIKDQTLIDKPILLHVKTVKGKGFDSPFACNEKYHAVSKFDLKTKEQNKKSGAPSYSKVFSESLCKIASDDEKVVAITAATPSGTALNHFAKKFPNRMYDVTIAEQHAVTFAAGLATDGIKPFVAIYSTFLQRAYDQVIHDVALQKIPVRFAIDRAGIVGADGATHAGVFDIAFLGAIPNIVLMAPSDAVELEKAVKTAYLIEDTPSAFRFPRGSALNYDDIPDQIEPFEIGRGRIIQRGADIAVLSLGTRLEAVKKACNHLRAKHNLSITIADARFAKPLDEKLIDELSRNHKILITVEEGSVGGFASFVAMHLLRSGALSNGLILHPIYLKDEFVEQGDTEQLYEENGLGACSIEQTILNLWQKHVKN